MKRLFLLVIACGIFLFGCKNQNIVNNVEKEEKIDISQSVDSYFIDGTLENNVFSATQKVNYVNKEDTELNELYFHLYPNMYKDKKMVEEETMSTKYPNGFNEGRIDIVKVSILDVEIETEIKDTLLKVNLPNTLPPMESVIITFVYATILPNSTSRMGYFNDTYNLTGFYPVAAVYDNGKWQTDKLSFVGDPFFTDIANYYVTLTLPNNFVVASSGTYTFEEKDSLNKLKIKGENIREMAIVASPHFKVQQGDVDGITVRSYYLNSIDDSLGKMALDNAMESLKYFNNAFGKYPYADLDVVGCEFTGGGMEYSGLTLIAGEIYKKERSEHLEWIIAHENAHQWWYGIVGNDPINNAFIDESLTEYSTLSYIQNKYDKNTAEPLKNRLVLAPYAKYKHLLTDDMTINRSTNKYNSSLELSLLVYNKGCMMYMDMENIMGKEKLMEVLKSYYETHAYSIVTQQNWKDHLKANYEYDWDSFFKKWLDSAS